MGKVLRDTVVASTASRNPFQILLLAASALSGAGTVFNFGPPPSLLVYLPDYAVLTWGFINLIGGLLGLIGAFWVDRILGLLMERLALSALAVPTLIYGVLVYAKNGGAAWTVSCFAVGFGLACIVRVTQVTRDLTRQRRWMDAHIHWDQDGGRRV